MRKKRENRYVSLVLLFGAAMVLIVLLLAFQAGAAPGPDTAEGGAPETAAADCTADSGRFDAIRMDETDQQRGDLVLVNHWNPWTFPENDALVQLFEKKNSAYSVRSTDILAAEQIIAPLNRMMQAFVDRTGQKDVNVISVYRSREEQQKLYDSSLAENGAAHTRRYVAQAGESEHHTGLAVDLQICRDGACEEFTGTGVYAWFYEHCTEYGFIRRYPSEKEQETGIAGETWHFRYVGAPHAAYMAEHGLCLEEYIGEIRKHPWNGTHLQEDGCEVYYCEGDTVYVPHGREYSVSGLNGDGFAVTVWQS